MSQLTCYFHMGVGKTGTSAIQAFLDTNRRILFEEHQCLYPNTNSIRPERGRQFNHGILFNPSLQHFKSDYEKIEKIIQITDFANKNRIPTVVFSFEAIFDFLQKFRELFSKLSSIPEIDIKGIVYFRRQDHWYSSAWKQWGIKTNLSSIEEYIQQNDLSHWYDHGKIFRDWIGPNSLIVKAYEKQQLLGGLIPDFLRTIGIDPNSTEWETPEVSNQTVNPGFSRDVLEYLQISKSLATHIHDNTLFDLVFKALGEKFQKPPFEKYDFLSPKQQLEILKRYDEMNTKIAVEFMGKDSGKLFLEELPDPDASWSPYPGLTVEALAQILTGILLHQQREIENMKKNVVTETINKIKDLT